MRKLGIQVENKIYYTLDYLDKPRWVSLWHQINEVTSKKPKSILEVGMGNGLVKHTLTLLGYSVKTLDHDRRLKPDYVGDIRQLSFRARSFDIILCAQVLEHLLFEEFLGCLLELHRVVKRYVILTLPHDYLTYFLVQLKIIPYLKPLTFFRTVPRLQTHTFNGQHYWEIGKRGYPLNKIKEKITGAGFTIEKTYLLPENPYHRFFILRK